MKTNEKVTISERIEDFLYDHGNKILYGSLAIWYVLIYLLMKDFLNKAILNGSPIQAFSLYPVKKK